MKISRNIISFIRSKELNHFNLQQNNKKESYLKLCFRTELGSYILYFLLLMGKKKIIPIAVLHHPRKFKLLLWGFCTTDLVINKFFYPKWHCLVAQRLSSYLSIFLGKIKATITFPCNSRLILEACNVHIVIYRHKFSSFLFVLGKI